MPWSGSGSERSSVTILMLALIVVAAAASLMLGHLGSSVVAIERAEATADAVALAGVTGGDRAAEDVARANGASVSSLDRRGMLVVARVRRAGATAVAAAQPAPR